MISLKSGNHKTGPIPTISRPQTSCPNTCPLINAGCYGENAGAMGRPSIFKMVGKAVQKISVRDIALRAPKAAPAIRFNVVGDYFNEDGTPDTEYIADTNFVAKARKWVAISYTHGWKRLVPSMFDYVVRASCQSREELQDAHARGWWTVVVDPGPEHPDTLIGQTIDGRKVVQCPATNHENISCADCRLCGREAAIVAFPVHGARKNRALNVVQDLRGANA
jgi:hypothetical protein